MFGVKSIEQYDLMGNITGASSRSLINPDELRKDSGYEIFAVIDQLAPLRFYKQSYLERVDLIRGIDYDDNPYHKREDAGKGAVV
jgi:hypothetical protein